MEDKEAKSSDKESRASDKVARSSEKDIRSSETDTTNELGAVTERPKRRRRREDKKLSEVIPEGLEVVNNEIKELRKESKSNEDKNLSLLESLLDMGKTSLKKNGERKRSRKRLNNFLQFQNGLLLCNQNLQRCNFQK